MHLIYIPVIHTKDKHGKEISKVCCRDFWKGRDSYRKLQNAYYEYITAKGFDLQRGLPSEETNRKNEKIQHYKQITNFENTKKVLENITLDLPETPNVKDIRKVMLNRDEKIENEIIKPRDELIQELYQENIALHKELSKQANIVDLATDYEKNHTKMLEDNINLKFKYHQLQESLEDKEKELQLKFDNKVYNIESQYKKQIKQLEKGNKTLNKMIDKFKTTLKKFIKWICHKFSYPSEDEIIRDFEKETYTNFNIEKQLDIKEFQKKEKHFDREL